MSFKFSVIAFLRISRISFSLSPDVGGNLPEILGYDETVTLLKESDDIYLKFGADTKVYGVDKEKEIREIRRKAITANLKLIIS